MLSWTRKLETHQDAVYICVLSHACIWICTYTGEAFLCTSTSEQAHGYRLRQVPRSRLYRSAMIDDVLRSDAVRTGGAPPEAAS
jgi:hypothetical protein